MENGSVDWKLVSTRPLTTCGRPKNDEKPCADGALRDAACKLQNRVKFSLSDRLSDRPDEFTVERDVLHARDGAPTGDVKERQAVREQNATPHRTAAGTPRGLHATTEPQTHHSTASKKALRPRALRPGRAVGREDAAFDGRVPKATLDLSHWTDNTTPDELYADASTEIALNLAKSKDYAEYDTATVVNNHFDVDGVLSAWAATDPESALPHFQLLCVRRRAGILANGLPTKA